MSVVECRIQADESGQGAGLMTAPWLHNTPITDVQSALQSEALQTDVERNTSSISDEGFQSFLNGAPIPRVQLLGDTQVIPDITATTVNWDGTTKFDPYGMFTSPIITIPLDGFYSFDCNMQHNFAGAYNIRWLAYISDTSAQFGAAYQLSFAEWEGAGLTAGSMNVPCLRAFNAGDSFHIVVFQSSGGPLNLAGNICNITGAWVAPYTSSQGAGVQ